MWEDNGGAGAGEDFKFPVCGPNCIVVLRNAHTHSAPSLSCLPGVAIETQPICSWTQIILRCGGHYVSCSISPLLFPSSDRCCDALACPWWKSSASRAEDSRGKVQMTHALVLIWATTVCVGFSVLTPDQQKIWAGEEVVIKRHR